MANPSLLQHVWKKRLRKGLRTMSLGGFELDHDPLECLAFDWEIDSVIKDVSASIATGHYRATSGEAIRGAKSVGLTRPIASLDPRDLLVYISAVHLFENDLLEKCRPWVRFGRSQSQGDASASAADSGWFRLWLKRQGQIWVITSTHEWIVETDVANFFGSLSIDRVCEHVLDKSRADAELVGVLRHALTQFVPMSNYQRSIAGGLPQENFDGSRVIAHTMLAPFDEEFLAEGQTDRYSRWVDDVVIGADTWPEALQCVRRAQTGLERLGLYPNSSKTKIFRRTEFEHSMYKPENDYIGEVDDQIKATGSPADRPKWDKFVSTHLRDRHPRRAWERVTRRVYTLQRKLESPYLISHAFKHLRDYPGSSAQILEYLATFRLTQARFQEVADVIDDLAGVYDDVDIRLREYMLLAPNLNSASLRNLVANWAAESAVASAADRPTVAASDSLLVAKFGNTNHVDGLAALFESLSSDSALRRQLAVILYALDRKSLHELSGSSYSSLWSSAQDLRFLRRIEDKQPGATKMALGMMQPVRRQEPTRFIVRPRMLVLNPLLARVDCHQHSARSPKWLSDMAKNTARLHDAAATRWIAHASTDPTTH